MNILARNNVHQIGSGQDVLLFANGFGCDQQVWSRITPAFATSHREVLFDYVGSGGSDLSAYDPVRYASLQGYVDDLLQVCDALDLKGGVHFVGHSAGANIGLMAALARPAMFSSLTLIGPSPCFINHPPHYRGGFEREDLEGLIALMEQNYQGWARNVATVAAGQQVDDRVAQTLIDSFCSADPVILRDFARVVFFADLRELLPRVQTPCLILQQRFDAFAPVNVGEFMHARLPRSTLKLLDIPGHCPHLSHPSLVIGAIREFLNSMTLLRPKT